MTRSSGWWNSGSGPPMSVRGAVPATRRAAREEATARYSSGDPPGASCWRPSSSGGPVSASLALFVVAHADCSSRVRGARPRSWRGRPRAVSRGRPSRGTPPAACSAGTRARRRARGELSTSPDPSLERPGSRRTTASTSASAGISPPERTYGPIETTSVQKWSRMRWSKPSNRAESSVSALLVASSSTSSWSS